MFKLKNVSKKFGNEYALRDISITIGKGLSFIIGASGSGKTTLLKILSGMEQSFEGEASYCGQDLRRLNDKEKSYFYHNIFGFVWQDFNLSDDSTVLENVMLPQYLGAGADEKAAMKLLRELKISELAGQKAGKLSGGQKQRVAIARELAKNPQVLFADEPTSALDEASSKAIMDILRDISKSRTVVVVTHDSSLLDEKGKIYELDKGGLISAPPELLPRTTPPCAAGLPHHLSPKSACALSFKDAKSKAGRFAAGAASLLIAGLLMLVAFSGAISSGGQSAFDELLSTYGQSILDINIAGSFMGAGGTDGQQDAGPNVNVSQDIGGLYDKYKNDGRVTHIVFAQAFDDIQITVDGKDYQIKSSGNVPSVNELTAGDMPMGSGGEVVVPNSFVKSLGLSDEQALGKTIEFKGSIYNWDSGKPVPLPVSTVVKIVGVVDSTVKYEYDGEIFEYSVDDSFFFSRSALDEMRAQAKTDNTEVNFTLRAKTPSDLMAIKDELNADGIVPLGRFELLEDIVRLGKQTGEQSGVAVLIIGVLSVFVALSVSLMTALSRRREYAIYKVSGYSGAHLSLLSAAEALLSAAVAALLFLVSSPLLNMATTAFLSTSILSIRMLLSGALLVLVTAIFSALVTALVASSTKAAKALTTGEK